MFCFFQRDILSSDDDDEDDDGNEARARMPPWVNPQMEASWDAKTREDANPGEGPRESPRETSGGSGARSS